MKNYISTSKNIPGFQVIYLPILLPEGEPMKTRFPLLAPNLSFGLCYKHYTSKCATDHKKAYHWITHHKELRYTPPKILKEDWLETLGLLQHSIYDDVFFQLNHLVEVYRHMLFVNDFVFLMQSLHRFISESYSLSILMIFIFVLNFVSAIAQKFINNHEPSLFSFIR